MSETTRLLWLDRTGAAARQVLACDLLDDDERSRRDRYHLSPDRDRFALGRGMVRLALAADLGAPASTLRFELGPFGRPALAGRPDGPWFNIAHSGDLVVVLLSTASPWIGVDVEADDGRVDVGELAGSVLAPGERAWLDGQTGPERRAAFFASWTLKEAYLKAIGLGLQRDPRRQVFDVSAGTSARSLDLEGGAAITDWRFARWTLPRAHHLAVAIRGAAVPLPVPTPMASHDKGDGCCVLF